MDNNKDENFNPYKELHKLHLQTRSISANLIVDIFSKYYFPESVVDFGCGVGAFLKSWKDKGVKVVKGLDMYSVKSGDILIDFSEFETVDFNNYYNIGNEKYDLAMSLEVGEHIRHESSKKFVNNIASLSDIVLFSAAIPFQGGVEHINCQPIQFWVDLFHEHGFNCFDFIRPIAIKNENIEWWYSQNVLVFARKEPEKILKKKGLNVSNNPIFFYHQRLVENLVYIQENKIKDLTDKLENNKILLEDRNIGVVNNTKCKENFLMFLGICYNKKYLKIVIFGINIVFKIGPDSINKIAWWIPVKKWRDNFRKKFE